MEPNLNFVFNFAVAVAMGALIGVERGMPKNDKLASRFAFSGLRTYTLISIVGFLSIYLSYFVGALAFAVLCAAICTFLLVAYHKEASRLHIFGITSEIAALATFLTGAIAYISPLVATLIGVSTSAILALKKPLHSFVSALRPIEFLGAIKFIIIAFVVLPFLPRTAIDPWGFFIPHRIWLMVVFISAISFVGYVLTKTIGTTKGLGMTGAVGGLVSSTAVTSSMSNQSKKNTKISNVFTFAVVISSAIMYIRVGIEVFVVNATLLPKLIFPLSALIGSSLIIAFLFWWNGRHKIKKQKTSEEIQVSSPFQLGPALKFGIFYLFVITIANFSNKFFGESGVYAASAFSGLADVDAITISLSNLVKDNRLTVEIATRGIIIAVLVNTLVKLAIIKIFGSKQFFQKAAVGFGIIFLAGLSAVLLV